ncbi:MAG TPA: serine hydrolase, partial [Candidatus Aminicenantes bacterium]|nr:serine hydrolase [Candidatus Aminicenantes bacterium]
AIGHDGAGNAVSGWDLPTLAGAGALRSTAGDMVKFIQANLSSAGPLAAALRRSHGRQRPVGGNTEIGLGWFVTKTPGGEIVWHNGQTGGYHSFLGLDPGRQTGVVVLHNSASDIDDIGFYLLDDRLPAPAKRRTEVVLRPEALEPLPGEYQLVPGFALTVTLDAGKLYVQATGQPRFQVFPGAETEFFYKEVDAQITFVKDGAGKVTGLVLHQNGRDLEGKRIR